MLARLPASQRLAWKLCDALLLIVHSQGRDPPGPFDLPRQEGQPLVDPERRHALYEAACSLSGESDSAPPVEPLLHAIDALLEEHRDLYRQACRLREDLAHTAGWQRRWEEVYRRHAERREELRRILDVSDDDHFGSPEEEWAELLARVAELHKPATVAAVHDAEAAKLDETRPRKSVWERIREDA